MTQKMVPFHIYKVDTIRKDKQTIEVSFIRFISVHQR